MRRALAVALLAALALPGTAFAHASLKQSAPTFRQRLGSAPTRVSLRFDQGVTVLPGAIVVYDASGRVVSGKPSGAGRGWVRAPLRRLPKGAYTVRWHVLSTDGHVVSGVYTFGVRTAAPPPTEAWGASGPTRTEHVVRWLYFLALALLVGGLGFRLLVVRGPLPPRAEKRFYVLTALGAAGALEVGIVAFLLRAEDALQLPLRRLLYGDLSPIASGTRFGTAFVAMTLGFALAATLLALAWVSDRRVFLWAAFAVGLGFSSGLSLSGHSAGDAGASWLSVLADWAHLTAATLWIGGLVQLALCVWPAAPELRRDAFLRFSRLATVLIGVVLSAGVYLSVLRLPHVHDLWTEGYGRVLLVKLALVGTALGWGAVHHFFAAPRLARGETSVLGVLSRSLVAESAVGMAVLLAAAVLVDSKPPPQGGPQPASAAHVSVAPR